ncbi:virginiamycin A acetyltransferase [Stackebrandtia albiflava]|uniref:Virginiamycin A acetyltransferase n=1 Tax=Stackebrandtia albiflava TaxID=406432 RepID=A0A562V502_9ACTN|nr:CatB-related O-acetyltransferase [Stackebrandtia albiflava]TWJ12974.1 virginiamycin A acetyltransferase [Stackebrandtia albiflava]
MSADPTAVHPLPGHPRVVFLKPLIDRSAAEGTAEAKIEVGEYTYYDDPDAATEFATRNVLYAYGPERLVIGRYCAIGCDTRFLMAGAAHVDRGPSTYPFTMFGGEWTERTLDIVMSAGSRGDTVVGNDVWIGYGATVMPGVTIGDGAIIATGAVVTSDVAPYTIVGGNPAREIRRRFSDADVDLLRRAAWWNWPVSLVTANVRAVMTGDAATLAAVAESAGLLAP